MKCSKIEHQQTFAIERKLFQALNVSLHHGKVLRDIHGHDVEVLHHVHDDEDIKGHDVEVLHLPDDDDVQGVIQGHDCCNPFHPGLEHSYTFQWVLLLWKCL